MAAFTVSMRNLLVKINFEAVLATVSCYDYDANASETVEKIPADEKDYHKCSLCIIVSRIAKAYHQ